MKRLAKVMLIFILNSLFAVASTIVTLATTFVWTFGVFWVNAPLDNVPGWLWIATGIGLSSLGILPFIREGWGYKFFLAFWQGENKPH